MGASMPPKNQTTHNETAERFGSEVICNENSET